ncbi:MAG: FMN-binding protein [Solirubrobacterales bacterium]|nr:FMN-binding protein [Solirubrobacterales bacterium]
MVVRRSPVVLAATIGGVAAVLSYHPHITSAGHAVQPAGIVAATPPATSSGSSPSTTKTRTKTPAAGPTVVTVVGADAPNRYGDVQVKVKVSGHKIVAVEPVALPGGDSRSQEISAAAAPILTRQALVAQSANINGVSGASYTSDGYRQSLQSALDQLGQANRPA